MKLKHNVNIFPSVVHDRFPLRRTTLAINYQSSVVFPEDIDFAGIREEHLASFDYTAMISWIGTPAFSNIYVV